MTAAIDPHWHPTCFRRFVRSIQSSTQIVEIVTDAGNGYLKALGDHISPHKLASELVGTQLAAWLGLPTFDFAVINIHADDEIPLKSGKHAFPGPAFVTRAHKGIEWSGDDRALDRIDNPDDISRLVVFDTLTLNWDRHAPPDMNRRSRPDNVFLSEEKASRGRFRIIAIDQSECFALGPELTTRLATIDRIQDERIFGLFPAFARRMSRQVVRAMAQQLKQLERGIVVSFTDSIPRQWEVSDKLRGRLADLIVARARFLADKIEVLLAPHCWPQGELDFGKESAT